MIAVLFTMFTPPYLTSKIDKRYNRNYEQLFFVSSKLPMEKNTSS